MGYYIEVPESRFKAKQLVDLYGAELVLAPEKFVFEGDNALICVIENGVMFDAAGVCYHPLERDDFLICDDGRPKTWLKMSKKKVLELNPHVPFEY